MLDVVFVTPNSSYEAYQELSTKYSAIEPPVWSLLLAETVRSRGLSAAILDCDAERLSLDESVKRVTELKARLTVFVLYGQNPNSGTTSMIGAVKLSASLKDSGYDCKICFCGSHVQALPKETLAENSVDLVLLNEGVYALLNLLKSDLKDDLVSIKGIGFKSNGEITLNTPERIVPQDRMDVDLPGYAWDLLPFKTKPLDLYRAHYWHANFDDDMRSPFAAIYTSLGCQFACDFCMINIINREDNGDQINASHSKGMRFWSADWVAKEFRKLADLGVKTLRISDEMFFLNRRFYNPILDNCIQNDYGFNMWAYSRVDTVRPDVLERFKKAGFNWIALGIESGNQVVRNEVSKGTFKDINIRDICRTIQANDINIISNYIFGLPDDDLRSMNETLSLALELNTEMANFYPCQALPGSPIYTRARIEGWELPKKYSEFAFLSYESKPLQTKHLSAAQVLRFRDSAWQQYFTNPNYLNLVNRKFGSMQMENIIEMSKIHLRRQILE